MKIGLSLGMNNIAKSVRSLYSRAKSIARRYNEPLLAIEDDFLELGPELVVNGDFSNGLTGWSAINGGSLSVNSGALRVTQTTSFGAAIQTISGAQAGKQYIVRVSKPSTTATNTQDFSVGSSASSAAYGLANLNSSSSPVFVTPSTDLRIFLQAATAAAPRPRHLDQHPGPASARR